MNRAEELAALSWMLANPKGRLLIACYSGGIDPTRPDITRSTTMTAQPETHTHGLGELIRAHRNYIGLSQREMAELLKRDRRDYQRIEIGRDACPPGLLTSIKMLADTFDTQVGNILANAEQRGSLTMEVDPDREWDRLVAGRAAVLSEDAPITITVVGEQPHERSA
jgi:transcriptional regulator with XRE-family HTH domain